MPRYVDFDEEFFCPYRHGCPHLEGLSTQWVWERYCQAAGLECQYEYVIKQLNEQLLAADAENRLLQEQNQQLRAQLAALHRRQFKGRRPCPRPQPPEFEGHKKKPGAPKGHPPWQRSRPDHIDWIVPVSAPQCCPLCQGTHLSPLEEPHHHLQEDIVLDPRVEVTCFLHQQVHCAGCGHDVHAAGPGELIGSYIGPAAKATAIYLRYELNLSDRKISRFFGEFFGLKFVPASAFGFERQAVRRGLPLYADLLDKARCLALVHADETSWRHQGKGFWVWCATDKDLALFHWDEHRSTEAAQELLGQRFGGILVTDAYASYNGLHPKGRQSCLAHIKTKAKELGQELALLKGRAADPKAQTFCQSIQAWVHEVCQAHLRLSQGPWRARRAKKKGRALRARLRRLCRQPLRYVRAEKFRRRLMGKEQKLFFTCFERPGVPPTNNLAERALRPVVLMRRTIQGTRSAQGLENHSVLRSLFETAKRQGKKAHLFFLSLLTEPTARAQAALYRKPLPAPEPQKRKTKKPP